MCDPLVPAPAALGASAFITQLVLMRELLSAFAGNELVLGIVLGSWFLLRVCEKIGTRPPRPQELVPRLRFRDYSL